MIAAVSTLGIAAIVVGTWLILIALFLALFWGAGKTPDFTPDRERLGVLEQDAAERQVRVERAIARHGDRRGRGA